MQEERLSINKWAEDDRPREKMMNKGEQSLSDAELLAILIGSGNKDESAVELMKRVLSACDNNLNTLAKWQQKDYQQFKGIGQAKSITIMAALELGRRRKQQEVRQKIQIKNSKDIYELYQSVMCDLSKEEFWVLLLNNNSRIIGNIKINSGGVDNVYIDVREVLREALLQRATRIVIVHNHPSGNTQPSKADIEITKKIAQSADIMNIKLLDHIIVCEDKYYSFADEGVI